MTLRELAAQHKAHPKASRPDMGEVLELLPLALQALRVGVRPTLADLADPVEFVAWGAAARQVEAERIQRKALVEAGDQLSLGAALAPFDDGAAAAEAFALELADAEEAAS